MDKDTQKKSTTTHETEELAVAPDLMDNRVIGHKPIEKTSKSDTSSQPQQDAHQENEAIKTADNSKVLDTSETVDTSRMSDTSETIDTSEAIDVLKDVDTAKSASIAKNGDTPNSKDTPHTQPHFSKEKPHSRFSRVKHWFKKHKIIVGGIGFGILLLTTLALALGLYMYNITVELRDHTQIAERHARTAFDQFKGQNLPATEIALTQLKESVTNIERTYQKLQFAQYVPIVRGYYQDGIHGLTAAQHGIDAGIKAVAAISPYADVLGFVAEDEEEEDPAAATAENRVKLLLETLTIIMPTLDEINEDLRSASEALNQINPDRYPETFRNRQIRSQLVEASETLDNAQRLLADYRPIIEHLPEIAGSNGERKKYLVLFQNDNELRPTGGFLTAYSVIFVEDGVVTPEKSDDIYELDQRFRKQVPIPESLGRYLTTERYFNLRDMNISPDFGTSMELFFENYQTIPGEPDDIDGIIAVDTFVLTRLLETVGPIEVPGYGTFSAENDPRCDCPQIIYALSEIITRPTPYIREDRKGILAPLMQALLARVYASPRTFMADLFEIGLESIEGRHVQTYFLNEEHQIAAERINAAGQLRSQTPDGDFLAIVNANLGGAKSNLFINYSVEQIIDGPEDGYITKSVEITYRNPRKADNCNLEAGLLCLNSTLRDWTRIYIPQGSKLLSAEGFTEEPTVYEELGFQVIDGFFILEPMGLARLRLSYKVPYETSNESNLYELTIWKQGGTNPIEHLIDVNGGQELFTVAGDTIVHMPF